MRYLLFMTIFVLLSGVRQVQAQNPSPVDCSVIGKPVVYLSHIVAMAQNHIIGNEHNEMPWGMALKNDLKRFRTLTSNHMVIMGRKTFDSMYASMGKVLPNRHSIVITRDPSKVIKDPNVTAVASIEEAIAVAQTMTDKYPNEVFVVGGGEIFTKTYPLVKKLYLTVISQDYKGVISYPKVDQSQFNLIKSDDQVEAGISYKFLDLEKKD